MSESSETCDSHGSADRRNCLGYAINEVYVGRTENGDVQGSGEAHAGQDQTATYCSSVDPWHEPAHLVPGGDQIGLDLFYTSGVTRGLPAMMPVAVTYGVPEDAVAQIAYLTEAGLPHLAHRAGRGVRRPVHDPRALRRPLSAVGGGAAEAGPQAQARRARVRQLQRGSPGLARPGWRQLVVRPLPQVRQGPRAHEGLRLPLLRALPVRRVQVELGGPLRGAPPHQPHHGRLPQGRAAARGADAHHRGEHGVASGRSLRRHRRRPVASRLHRVVPPRRGRRLVLLPLPAVAAVGQLRQDAGHVRAALVRIRGSRSGSRSRSTSPARSSRRSGSSPATARTSSTRSPPR